MSFADAPHRVGCLSHAADAPLPGQKRVPFGWRAAALPAADAAAPAQLRWSGSTPPANPARLRLTAALDDSELRQIDLHLTRSGQRIGTLDIRYAYACQIFELPLSAADTAAALEQGLTLRMAQGQTPFWIFDRQPSAGPGHEVLMPHLAFEPEPGRARPPLSAFDERFPSLASVQPFGWMEGCVLEGLEALAQLGPGAAVGPAAQRALGMHLDLFFPAGRMVYENPRSVPGDDRWDNIEATLMAAALARHRPDHPALDRVIDFWQTVRPQQGRLRSATCEGFYTVAYPMAVLARLRRRDDLAEQAVEHARARLRQLLADDSVYLRHRDGQHSYRNWARGVAWCLMGISRLLMELRDRDGLDDIKDACRRLSQWTLQFQQPDGLWCCYLHEPETGPETSGSAGIAAALLLAHARGLAGPDARGAAEAALQGLRAWLTPDGLLVGGSQSNKTIGGEPLQRGGYRVASQFGMGLLAQLLAAREQAGPAGAC